MNDKIEAIIDRIIPDVVKWRHQIHQNPEIALKEYETSKLVRLVLDDAGIVTKTPFIGTDVVAFVGDCTKKNVTLRADMDALPLLEKTGLPYASKNEGVMHACGHDGHTAMLMGAALVLSELESELTGSVRFVFQPGEELTAAGRDLVEAGALFDPEPSSVMAMHGWPGLPAGVIASRVGNIFASADIFSITVKGNGAHGSTPHMSIDPIVIGCHIVDALQGIVSRETAAQETLVISVCKFNSGLNHNVIPDTAVIGGTVRYYNHELGKKVRQRIEEIAVGICAAMGATCEFEYEAPYIQLVNNAEVVELGKKVVGDIFGSETWIEFPHPSMGGEDFAYYVQDYPGAMFALGVGEDRCGLHNPNYDFNDDAIKNGIMFFVSFALAALDG
jgi:amidohydrolase